MKRVKPKILKGCPGCESAFVERIRSGRVNEGNCCEAAAAGNQKVFAAHEGGSVQGPEGRPKGAAAPSKAEVGSAKHLGAAPGVGKGDCQADIVEVIAALKAHYCGTELHYFEAEAVAFSVTYLRKKYGLD